MIIDDWGKFDGVITGTAIGTHLTSTDLIDVTQLPYIGGSMSVSVSYNSGTNISTTTFSDGISANNVTLHLSGNYAGTAWSFTSINGGAGTEIYDPQREVRQGDQRRHGGDRGRERGPSRTCKDCRYARELIPFQRREFGF